MKKELLEEVERQIEKMKNFKIGLPIFKGDAERLLSLLGHDKDISETTRVDTVNYYINLLIIKKLLTEK